MFGQMQLDLTDEEAAALINLLTGIIEADQYPMSRRLKTLRQIRAKLPGIRIEPPSRSKFRRGRRSRQ
jgi:hypothetical protein